MAKISANYEVVYIIDPAQGEEAIAATVAKFQTLAEQNNAINVVVDEWGKRRLAFFAVSFAALFSFPTATEAAYPARSTPRSPRRPPSGR